MMERFHWLFEVNVFGLLAVSQAFLPLLRQGNGRLVNITSIASIFVVPFHGPYSASKMSVNGLIHALRMELRPLGVDVALVICGSINTPIWEKGGQMGQEVWQAYPPETAALYGKAYQKISAFLAGEAQSKTPPEEAARAIAHALTAKRPKITYLVGKNAWLFNVVDRLLFGRLRDRAILWLIGMG